jgi:serine/threonine protein kinase
MVDMLQDHWSGVGYDNIYISPTWTASVATAGHTVPALATPFYRNGNVFDYVRLHPDADRLDLLCQAASALAHIHSKGVVHGNICPVSFAFAVLLVFWLRSDC